MTDNLPPRSQLLSRQQVLSMYLPALVFSLGQGIIVPVLPVFAKSFEITFGVASLAFVAYQLGAFVSAFPSGYLVDRVGRKPMLIAGPVVMAGAAFLVATSQSFTELLIYRFIGGMAEPLWLQSRLALIADTAIEDERGRQVTWMVGLQRGGQLFGPAVGGFLAELFGVRVPFVVYGVLVLLTALPSIWLVAETRHQIRAAATRAAVASGVAPMSVYRELFQSHLLVFYGLSLLANFSRAGFNGNAVALYAVYVYDMGPGTLATITTIASIMGTPVPFFTGWVMDHFGRKAVIRPAYILSGVGMFLIAFTTIGPLPMTSFIAAFLFAQITQSTTSGTMQTLATDFAPQASRGRFLAVWRMFSNGANVLGPAAIALISDRASYLAAFGTIGMASLLTALWATVALRETGGRARTAPRSTSSGR